MFIERMSSWTKGTWSHGVRFVQNKKNTGKLALGIFAVFLLVSGTIVGGYIYQSNLSTLYRVAIDGKDIGVVDNPQMIQKWLADMLVAEKKKYPHLAFGFNKKITITEEKHYAEKKLENKAVLDRLASEIKVEANAAQLVVNGKAIAYARDKKSIEQALTRLKAMYSEKKSTHALMVAVTPAFAPKVHAKAQPDLSDVSIKEHIDITYKTISPTRVLNDEQLMNVLLKGVPEQKNHVIKAGETLWNIASQYGLKEKELLALNPHLKEDSVLQIGDTINVQAFSPQVTVVSRKEMVETVAIPYPVKQQNDPKKYRGDDKVVIQGKNGSKQIVYELIKENGKLVRKNPVHQKILQKPVAQVVIRGTKIKPSRGDGHFRMPVVGLLSSRFGMRWGRMHEGIDIANPVGTPVHTADHGRVVFAGEKSGYGKCMIVDHGNGYRTLYGHLSSFIAKPGDIVVKGEVIAKSGNTGRSTGPHLHFEIRKNGEAVDPLPYLR
ncbi:peptidoglycan DD-metalloendopeptidase family protein [Aneurinibacillus thermoaerophilus]|uniref:peptidoglycan DD-metalloendopeptidase family protein n=1 Tax=Aneurinibacillus thermoaerophilus TaxID=143495 RepID=UPI002E1B9F59|nr:peptidoglycan DD-metalloendopeptidase family protein [Aneurinibacillus thermoaerophilus]